jgi:hypothetical protein
MVRFEAKGTDTKNIQKTKHKKDQESPIIQTFTYMAGLPCKFGVTTNIKSLYF